MNKLPYRELLIIAILLLIIGCRPQRAEIIDTEKLSTLNYAQNLDITTDGKTSKIIIKEPYKGAYASVTFSSEQPVKRIVCTSTSQIGFLDLLDAQEVLAGYTTTDYISSLKVRQLIDSGRILDIGRDIVINIEKLLELKPDLVVAYSVTGDISQWEQLESFGIPVIFDASHLEETPLAQAEWIKLFGALLGIPSKADSIFKVIESNYTILFDKTATNTSRPTIICGSMYNGTWFMPGGKSWVASYINDAGGDYLWNELTETGSVPLSFEVVFEHSHDADIWIGATIFNNISSIETADDRYASFKSVAEKRIFTPVKRLNGLGGNDYYEMGIARPDLVLADFIKILQPDLLDDDELYFYKKLE
ncbi:MAG: ABC transporter substrate-binding protein [Bacteroidetes bacterium]|nr:ABC transporter substrate-binding protein [Bacteroidota bacterium]MDA1120579.1 ABC transporter substrate-binding protein [Bacteroidota bacterium]